MECILSLPVGETDFFTLAKKIIYLNFFKDPSNVIQWLFLFLDFPGLFSTLPLNLHRTSGIEN